MTELGNKIGGSARPVGELAAKEDTTVKETKPLSKPFELRKRALSRWDNEGGALKPMATNMPEMTNTELVQLRIRVIALENLVLALLARADEEQIALLSDMIGSIMPRVGATPHPLTIHAAFQMRRLMDRANYLRP